MGVVPRTKSRISHRLAYIRIFMSYDTVPVYKKHEKLDQKQKKFVWNTRGLLSIFDATGNAPIIWAAK